MVPNILEPLKVDCSLNVRKNIGLVWGWGRLYSVLYHQITKYCSVPEMRIREAWLCSTSMACSFEIDKMARANQLTKAT